MVLRKGYDGTQFENLFPIVLLAVVPCKAFPYRPRRRLKAPWRNGYAEDCKSLNGGSIPSGASNFPVLFALEKSSSMQRVSRL